MDAMSLPKLVIMAIALSAACGFRIFLPPLGLAFGVATGLAEVPETLRWIGSPQALTLLATASVLEVLAYFVPWVDNLLDSVATPAAVVAGTLLSAFLLGELDPMTKWTLALVAGGGASGLIQASSASLRLASTATTGGVGNFMIAGLELLMAGIVTVTAILLPLAALALVVLLVIASIAVLRRVVKVMLPTLLFFCSIAWGATGAWGSFRIG